MRAKLDEVGNRDWGLSSRSLFAISFMSCIPTSTFARRTSDRTPSAPRPQWKNVRPRP